MLRNYNQMVMGQIPRHWGNRATTKNKIAVKCDDGFTLTWNELNIRSNQVAQLLKDRGIVRGDKVAVYLNNCGQYPEIVFGIAKIGACVVPISFRFIDKEVRDTLELSEAKAIFTHDDISDNFFSEIKDLSLHNENAIFINKNDLSEYNSLLNMYSAEDFEYDVDENDFFWMAFTGGTTGKPKACTVTNRMKMTYCMLMTLEYGASHEDIMLVSGAMNYGLSFMHSVQMLYLGGTVYVLRSFDAQNVLRTIEREKISVMPIVPTMLTEIMSLDNKDNYDVRSMRVIPCTGAPLALDVKLGVVEFFYNAVLNEFYGVSELGMFTTSKLRKGDDISKAASVGLPAFCTEVKVLKENGEEAGVREVGNLYKRGPLLSTGYYKDEEATKQLFYDGWACAGDLGYVDEDGYYYLVGRSKDMIISGGVNLYPAELENVIMNLPSVLEVSVIGVPDDRLGETARAYVVKKAGANLTESEIIQTCVDNLARYKRPRSVEFVDELPKSVAGKVLKKELKKLYLEKNGLQK